MKARALRKARDRLRAAESAFEQMRATEIGAPDFDHAWYAFLVSQNSFYSALEQGAKNGPSKGWFDKKKNERKQDLLLNYLHQARNAEEHSLGSSIGRTRNAVFTDKTETVEIDEVTGRPHFNFTVGEEASARFKFSYEILLPVSNYGVTFAPPTESLYAMKAADLCIQRLREVLREAEERIDGPDE